jgi:hypothetical protein
MVGLVPTIHVFLSELTEKGVDVRDKRGHDVKIFAIPKKGCGRTLGEGDPNSMNSNA